MRTFNSRTLYAYKFMGQCLPIYAFYTILFIERGMSITDIAVLMALWSGFTIVFEIPSGVLADRWNRRNMLAIAAGVQGLCFLIWFYSHTFWGFAAGFVFWAAGAAFISGTEEGLIYDNLKSDGCEEDFARVYGKARFYANAGMVAGIISAGIAVSFISVGTIALISVGICLVNIIMALQIREKNYYAKQLEGEPIGFLKTFKDAAVFIKGSAAALIAVCFMVFFASLGDYLDEFDALIVNDLELSNIWVSIIMTVRFGFLALGDILAPIVQKRLSSLKQIFVTEGLACVFLLLFTIVWNQYAFFIFGAALMIMAVTEILLVNVLQNEIKAEGRATVMSFLGIGQNLMMVGFSLIYALLAEIFTLQQVYMILAVYGIGGGLSFYLYFRIIKK